MYTGRSIGRMLWWLREYCHQADDLTFFGKHGEVMYHGDVFIRSVFWDLHDTPIFDFVNDDLFVFQRRNMRDILNSEHRMLSHDLEPFQDMLFEIDSRQKSFERVLRTEVPTVIRELFERGMLIRDEKLAGWAEDGKPLFDYKFNLIPQAIGFLRYLEKKF